MFSLVSCSGKIRHYSDGSSSATVAATGGTFSVTLLGSSAGNEDTSVPIILQFAGYADGFLCDSSHIGLTAPMNMVVDTNTALFSGTPDACTITLTPHASAFGVVTVHVDATDFVNSVGLSIPFTVRQLPDDIATTGIVTNLSNTINFFVSNGMEIDAIGSRVYAQATKDRITNTFSLGTTDGTLEVNIPAPGYESVRINPGLSDPSNTSTLSEEWTPAWANLWAYFPMNSTTAGKGAYTLTAVGSASLNSAPDGKVGVGANFTGGAHSRFDITDDGTLDLDVFTVSAWIKTTDATASQAIYSNYRSDDSIPFNGTIFAINQTGSGTGHLRLLHNNFEWITSISQVISPGGIIQSDRWYHAVATRSAGGTGNIYLNGVLVATGSLPDAASFAGASPQIGSFATSVSHDEFKGSIDEVAIWNTDLNAAQIMEIYKRQKANFSGKFDSRIMDSTSAQTWTDLNVQSELPYGKALPDGTPSSTPSETSAEYPSISTDTLMNGIQGLWHFDETSANSIFDGSDFKDNSGSNRQMNESGSVTFPVPGIFSNAVQLDGVNDRIQSTSPMVETGGFTWSVWFHSSGNQSNQTILSVGTAATNGYSFILNESACYSGLSIKHEDKVTCETDPGLTILQNDWNHLVVTRTLNTTGYHWNIYLNGSSAVTLDTNALVTQTGFFTFGSRSNGTYPFMGVLDEFAYWSRVLTDAEISDLDVRGRSRLLVQVRDCAGDVTCSSAYWMGQSGSVDVFSENNNRDSPLSATAKIQTESLNIHIPDYSYSIWPASRYFQYRLILESDTATSPTNVTVSKVEALPGVYPTSTESLTCLSPVDAFSIDNLGISTVVPVACDNMNLVFSPDGLLWYYFNGTSFLPSNLGMAQTTNPNAVTTFGTAFYDQFGTNYFYWKVIVQSAGAASCQVKQLDWSVKN